MSSGNRLSVGPGNTAPRKLVFKPILRQLEVFTWNLNGTQRDEVLAHIHSIRSDLLVLTEYRVPKRGDRLREQLKQTGWIYQETSAISNTGKGVLLASKTPISRLPFPTDRCSQPRTDVSASALLVKVTAYDFDLLGIHIPYKSGAVADVLYRSVIHLAKQSRRRGFVAAGDFNSTLHSDAENGRAYGHRTFWIGDIFNVLVDCYDKTRLDVPRGPDDRYTFKTLGVGRRLDYIFASESLAKALVTAEHDHTVRHTKLSDHSAVIARFAFRSSTRRKTASHDS